MCEKRKRLAAEFVSSAVENLSYSAPRLILFVSALNFWHELSSSVHWATDNKMTENKTSWADRQRFEHQQQCSFTFLGETTPFEVLMSQICSHLRCEEPIHTQLRTLLFENSSLNPGATFRHLWGVFNSEMRLHSAELDVRKARRDLLSSRLCSFDKYCTSVNIDLNDLLFSVSVQSEKAMRL